MLSSSDLAYDQAPGHGTCNTAELSGPLVDVGPVDETEPVDLFEFIPDDEDSDSEGQSFKFHYYQYQVKRSLETSK